LPILPTRGRVKNLVLAKRFLFAPIRKNDRASIFVRASGRGMGRKARGGLEPGSNGSRCALMLRYRSWFTQIGVATSHPLAFLVVALYVAA
jgi:hypothetical protein